jgi:hypothetical protein
VDGDKMAEDGRLNCMAGFALHCILSTIAGL